MTYSKVAQARYNKKGLQFSVNYRQTDIKEGKRLKEYLTQSGQSANSYIKGLIKNDLDEKGFVYDDDRDNDPD